MNATATKPDANITTIIPRRIIVLKSAQCSNLSSSATLSYQVGCTDENEILFRIDTNSSSGYFSREWVRLVDIQRVFAEVPTDGYLNSYTLHSVLNGKSTCTSGFLMAALLAEGLVQRSSINDRGYECTDGKQFFSEIQVLIDSGISLDPDAKNKKSIRTTGKKKSASEAAPSAV